MDIESHSSCGWDYLELGDSSTRLCGTDAGQEFTSSGNVVTVSFHTDGSVTRTGFTLTYAAVAAGGAAGGGVYGMYI